MDIISAWAFDSLGQISTADWLQTKHRTTATGLGSNVEEQYTTTMQNKYSVPFVGTVETVLATDTIKCFCDLKAWQGNGLGDEIKERLVPLCESAQPGTNNIVWTICNGVFYAIMLSSLGNSALTSFKLLSVMQMMKSKCLSHLVWQKDRSCYLSRVN